MLQRCDGNDGASVEDDSTDQVACKTQMPALDEEIRHAALTSGGRNQRLKFAEKLGNQVPKKRHSILAGRLLEIWCLGIYD